MLSATLTRKKTTRALKIYQSIFEFVKRAGMEDAGLVLDKSSLLQQYSLSVSEFLAALGSRHSTALDI